ncbi:MAG TPA: lysophospholipid acyltransferase family protein [Jatrophihabitantaceae bacterium]|nr:lysophospholipid acyltransferase family protein [Jatrophihabitantaceae bacterium]
MSRLHKPKAGFWIRLCATIIVPLTQLLYRIRWTNLEGITPPDRGGVILAMNHTSHMDTLLMARLGWQAGRIPRFMIKASLFHKPGTGQIFRGSKQIPVYRGTTDAAQSLRDAVAALARGEAIAIYPEGTITRAPGQWPMQAKTGIARLWLLSPDTPVIPIGQWGAQQRKFTPMRFVRRPTSYASVGKPVDLERFRGAEPTAAVLREITDTIMGAIRDEVAALRGEPAPAEFYRPSQKFVDQR